MLTGFVVKDYIFTTGQGERGEDRGRRGQDRDGRRRGGQGKETGGDGKGVARYGVAWRGLFAHLFSQIPRSQEEEPRPHEAVLEEHGHEDPVGVGEREGAGGGGGRRGGKRWRGRMGISG